MVKICKNECYVFYKNFEIRTEGFETRVLSGATTNHMGNFIIRSVHQIKRNETDAHVTCRHRERRNPKERDLWLDQEVNTSITF